MTLPFCLLLSALLFVIGVFGLLTKRHLIGMLISMELMLNAANINFISFAHFTAKDSSAGILFSIFVIAITACEMAVALAILISMYRNKKSLDADTLEVLHD